MTFLQITYLSPTGFHFRHQRMQHLCSEFARLGHTTIFVEGGTQHYDVPLLAEVGQNLYTLRLRSHPELENFYQGTMDGLSASDFAGQMRSAFLSLDRPKPKNQGHVQQILILGHPAWGPLIRHFPDAVTVYDRLDRFDNFPDATGLLGDLDLLLCEACNITLYTTAALEPKSGRSSCLVRNATVDWPPEPRGLKHDLGEFSSYSATLCYVGAIDEWFDFDLFFQSVAKNADFLFLLAGRATVPRARFHDMLPQFKNLLHLGEIRHSDIPWVYRNSDLQLMPFKRTALTDAVDPVKAYEAAFFGVPTLSTELQSLEPFPDEVLRTTHPQKFDSTLRAWLADLESDLEASRERASEWARRNTWDKRAGQIIDVIHKEIDAVSLEHVILAFGDATLTLEALETLRRTTPDTQQILVIDNGSTIPPAKFAQLVAAYPNSDYISLGSNFGFAAGMNHALDKVLQRSKRPSFVALHNNDVRFFDGWYRPILNAFRTHPTAAAICPSTPGTGGCNRVPTHSIDVSSEPRPSLQWFSRLHTRPNFVSVERLGFASVVIRVSALDEVGLFDEAFGHGYFEDDDWCQRALDGGWEIGFCSQSLLHHAESASFSLIPEQTLSQLYSDNSGRFFEKHGFHATHRPFNPNDFDL